MCLLPFDTNMSPFSSIIAQYNNYNACSNIPGCVWSGGRCRSHCTGSNCAGSPPSSYCQPGTNTCPYGQYCLSDGFGGGTCTAQAVPCGNLTNCNSCIGASFCLWATKQNTPGIDLVLHTPISGLIILLDPLPSLTIGVCVYDTACPNGYSCTKRACTKTGMY